MKITGVRAWPVDMPLKHPYRISYARYDRAVNIFLALDTDTGITGYGVAAPDPHVTAEEPAEVLKALIDDAPSLLRGRNALARNRIDESVARWLPTLPAAQAAVDMALFDLLGKQAGLPLSELLGGYRNSVRTSVTIGISSVGDTIKEAGRLIADGFSCLKIKGGADLESDIERTMQVRRSVGPRVTLRFDANQGYTVKDALTYFECTRDARIELLEQPTPKADMLQLAQVSRRVSVPVTADESLLGVRDAYRLARNRLVDVVNIKLMKVGGMSQAVQVYSIARAAGIDVMVGCMDEAGLSIAAGLHLALALPGIRYVDLDGHLGLSGDSTTAAVILRKGVLRTTGRPGLGFEPEERGGG